MAFTVRSSQTRCSWAMLPLNTENKSRPRERRVFEGNSVGPDLYPTSCKPVFNLLDNLSAIVLLADLGTATNMMGECDAKDLTLPRE